MAYGLRHPWAVAFLPSGDFLVTEQEGSMRIVDTQGRVGPPLTGVPAVDYAGQGGLLDVALDRDFLANRRLYFCYAQSDAGSGGSRSTTALASATLNERQDRLEHVQVLFHQSPSVRSNQHFGCRIAQAQDGSLFLTLGDRFIARDQAQRTSNHLGSIVRLQPNGSASPDNPFVDKRGGLPETWSWGHRNPLGAVITPDGELWTHEAGAQGGDEFNHIRGGANYGWPVVSYGVGQPKNANRAGMEPPVHYWRDELQPSGLAYLNSDRYGPEWQDSFFLGSLTYGALVRLKVVDDKVQEQEWLKVAPGTGVRDVRQGPDGLLYVLIDGPDGRLLRIEPTHAEDNTLPPFDESDAPTHSGQLVDSPAVVVPQESVLPQSLTDHAAAAGKGKSPVPLSPSSPPPTGANEAVAVPLDVPKASQ
ncbi:PQQ-dependent sugar dehydrogenase [Lampropedia puyangensis]|uniref:PQQ-dependent sugar dehydrogenase n=2 Tax=Lampropedia puyangensis TaxID=1330072 RepID=A0A4S8ESQ2_9BURK|nr:PQQ-dependent sugar dehydrogenase [Lampropedia puyangensis]